MTDSRYKVVEGSQSGHCCFDFTVVDTSQIVMIGGVPYPAVNPHFEAVCETFTREDADLIAKALNNG